MCSLFGIVKKLFYCFDYSLACNSEQFVELKFPKMLIKILMRLKGLIFILTTTGFEKVAVLNLPLPFYGLTQSNDFTTDFFSKWAKCWI